MTYIIYGTPRDKWEEVQAIQHEPFIFISSNGSRWYGEQPGDIAELLAALGKYALDVDRFDSFCTVDPCSATVNPKWMPLASNTEPQWIDGKRLYEANGVCRYFGNFSDYSHVFNIDTNDKPTIDALDAAIKANLERQNKAA